MAAETLVPLALPHGRQAEIYGNADDRSVVAVLQGAGGQWEPHIRRLLESLVEPQWTCLDLGANIGAHTLTLACLATAGEVIAFEPGEENFAHLKRNLATLPAPAACVTAVRRALWDVPGFLNLATTSELAGCSFVSLTDDASSEALLRSVVTSEEIQRIPLRMGLEGVLACPLDDWVAENGLERLDLIKLDVEGSESKVLPGALETLRRFKPLLLTEYNPACAERYFRQAPGAYFELLTTLFSEIRVIEDEGLLSEPLTGWEPLRDRLETGRGWEDLLCRP
jgi:FkbM family methyltransferase